MANGSVQKIAVIGAGSMGCQIAALFADCGFSVLLLDNQAGKAAKAVETMENWGASLFLNANNRNLIASGDIPADFDKIKEADWIIEAVTERIDVKAALYREIEEKRKNESIITSTTCVYPFALLVEGQTQRFARNFLVTHFFAPIRQTRLIEIAHGVETPPELIFFAQNFCDRVLGKSVIVSKDTPGFITTRVTAFLFQVALEAAIDLGISLSEADAVFEKPIGLPSTSVFGLMDEIGIDTVRNASKTLASLLEPTDTFTIIHALPDIVPKMIMDGFTGNRGKGGFYRRNASGEKEVLDLRSGRYEPIGDKGVSGTDKTNNLRALCESEDKIGIFCWRVLSQTLLYVSELIPEVSSNVLLVDQALRNGCNWEYGPFELIDKLGADWFIARLRSDGNDIPPLLRAVTGRSFYTEQDGRLCYLTCDGYYTPVPQNKDTLSLASIKLSKRPIYENLVARLWDIDDGVMCLEFAQHVNAVESDTFRMVKKAVTLISEDNAAQGGKWKGLVLTCEGKHFSTGADLTRLLTWAQSGNLAEAQVFIQDGKEALQALRYAPFPSVAAVYGMTLGGGCEIALHASAIQAHAETHMGLVETTVGLIPALGGCLQMLGRAASMQKRFGGTEPPVFRIFDLIMKAKVSKSAAEAQEMIFMSPSDGITRNKARLLFDAKQRVLSMAKNYKAPEPWTIIWTGAAGRSAMNLEIDALCANAPSSEPLARAIVDVLCGGEENRSGVTPESTVLDAETRAFMRLFGKEETAFVIEKKLVGLKRAS